MAGVPAKKKIVRPSLKVFYLGNFGPPHSSENHILAALVDTGHFVVPIQESHVENWRALAHGDWTVFGGKPDLILWTRTGWPWGTGGQFGSNDREPLADQVRMMQIAREAERRDGLLDVIPVNTVEQSFGILFGRPGGFVASQLFALPSPPIQALVSDYNQDGTLDVAIALNRTARAVELQQGLGGRSFSQLATLMLPSNVRLEAQGDLNAD